MKKLTFSLPLILAAFICMSFQATSFPPVIVAGTKWISPINDNCFDSLCFTSESTVMYYNCQQNLYAELGYKIIGDKIEIEAYSKSSMSASSKMILVEDSGILKQQASQDNNFPKNFIKVPEGACN